jgi:hypothetical protein
MAQSAKENVTPRSGVTRKPCPGHSRAGGNPWDLPKSWTKGTGLREQQDFIKIAEKIALKKQCITCVMACWFIAVVPSFGGNLHCFSPVMIET